MGVLSKIMNKKIIILILIFVILAIGSALAFYLLWQGGPDLRSLNKGLPEGIRVEKRNNQEVIVNKLDGYEITIPENWGGIGKAEYVGKKQAQFIIGAKKTDDRVVLIVVENNQKLELAQWIKNRFQEFQGGRFYNPLIVGEEKIGNYNIVKVQDESPVGVFFFYYIQKDSKIYEIYSDYSEKSIKDIILSGNF